MFYFFYILYYAYSYILYNIYINTLIDSGKYMQCMPNTMRSGCYLGCYQKLSRYMYIIGIVIFLI